MLMSKWSRTGITPDILKDFFFMYKTNSRKVQFSEGERQLVDINKIIPQTKDWKDTIWMYKGLLGRIDRNVPYQKSAWHKHEIHNQVPDIQKRFNRFRELYKSIKKKGFIWQQRRHIKLLDVTKLRRKNPIKGGRISYKYFRINGMRRILICKYLGIKKIPCRVYKVSIG
jgi:hypothetical protein